MAAVLNITQDRGGTDNTPATETTETNIRFNVEDTNDQDVNSPIPIPGAGTGYSYPKHIYAKCATAPDTQIDGMEVYTDGTLGWGTGVTVTVGDGVQTKNSGSDAGYDVADAAEILTNHTHISAKTDLFTFTSGAPRTLTISESGSIIDAIGETTDYIVLSCEVESTATEGTKAIETITFSWDEI